MKSLNSINGINSEIFTPDIMIWIEKEGFEWKSNDSYGFNAVKDLEWENNCFRKLAGYYGSNHWPVSVYIFKSGISVDIDYDCGGNSSNIFWKFSDYNDDFEYVYDMMVNYVSGYVDCGVDLWS